MKKSQQFSLTAMAVAALASAGSGTALADAGGNVSTHDNSGLLTGFVLQDVRHDPSNSCGNTGSAADQNGSIVAGGDIQDLSALQLSAFNPAFGNTCNNVSSGH
ncbi:hypothetical protein [Streptomyces poriticola]|uniref:hypothetical protein n=1 Tax=Streptomyces poriticola TaxID=3120506 RepID=UPI002FCE29B2